MDELADAEKFTEFLPGRGWFDAEYQVGRFCCSKVVGGGAYPADPGRDPWRFLDRGADKELLKPPQFNDLKVGRVDLPFVVEVDLNACMPFDPGHRTDRDLFHLLLSFTRSRIFELSLSSMIRLPMVKAYIVCATS